MGALPMRSSRLVAVTLAGALFVAAACGGDDDDDQAAASSSTSPPSSAPALEGTLTVFAAASLTDAFEELGTQFEAAHEGTSVEFNFAASSELATQVQEGAPADVLASA